MRSLWNGAISFGLINIPIKIYSAAVDHRLNFDLLDKNDHQRIRYKRVNEKSGKEIPYEEIVKGYKIEDKYVIINNDDFDRANMKKSKTIDLEEFVKEDEVADFLFKKPYYLEPAKGGSKSYTLLRNALEKSKKLGVATFVMRNKEHLCLIGTHKKALILHDIRFGVEIRDVTDLKLPNSKVSKKEEDMALNLIEQYTEKFKVNKYKDEYTDQLLNIIEEKSKGIEKEPEKFDVKPTAAKDLMAKLKASLENKKSKAG